MLELVSHRLEENGVNQCVLNRMPPGLSLIRDGRLTCG